MTRIICSLSAAVIIGWCTGGEMIRFPSNYRASHCDARRAESIYPTFFFSSVVSGRERTARASTC